jgi:predicted outer membrane protein
MKRKLIILSVVILATGMSTVSFAQQKTSQSKSTYSSSKSMISTSQASDDTLFIKRALAIGVAEIEFAQVALQNSSSEKVKNFAQKMIEDHSSANNKLMAIMNGTTE